MATDAPLPSVTPRSRAEWRAWLKRHHKKEPGVWLVCAKKHTGLPSLTWQEAVEEALCFGWIDGVRNAIDDSYFKQRFSPRKPRSTWSAINKRAVERLRAEGLMTPAGEAAVAAAKANGQWEALDDVEAMVLPHDFKAALAKDPIAKKNFERYARFVQKQFLYRLNSAKRPATRAERIATLIAAAHRGVNPFRVPRKVPKAPARSTARRS